MKINGPYTYNSGPNEGRQYVNITRDDGSRTTCLYSRYLYEQAHGPIPDGMEVDHVDGDKTNDVIENLQLLTKPENVRKHAIENREVEMVSFICPQCGDEASKPARHVRHNRKNGSAGPFCGRSCAGKWK